MELDLSHERAVKRVAKTRFGGDEDAAFDAIFETGIKHTPIPKFQPPSLTRDGKLRIHYTDRQGRKNPCLPGHRHRPRYDHFRVLGTEKTGNQYFELCELLSDVELICHYQGINHDNLSFSIADNEGNWFGWGVNTLATALQETTTRYDTVGREPEHAEIIEVLLPLKNAWLHCRVDHRHDPESFQIFQFKFYTKGKPVGYEPYLQAIADHFNRQLTVSKPVRRTFAFADSIPVTPITYLTGSDGEQVTRLIIDCPRSQLQEVSPHENTDFLPEECVIQVYPDVPVEEARDREYRLTNLCGFKLTTGTWVLECSGESDPIV